jgi:hypothetical protein
MKFFWKRIDTEREADAEKRKRAAAFRSVFLSPEGQEVLQVLLNDWSFFDVCDTEEKRILNDYAKIFLHNHLGINKINVYSELDKNISEG